MNAHHASNLGGYHGALPGAGGGMQQQALSQPQLSSSHHHPMSQHPHHHAPPPHLVMEPSTYDFDAPLRHTGPPPPHPHHVGLMKHDLLEPPPPHLMVLDPSGHYRNPASMNGFYAAAVGGQQDEQGGGGGSASSSSSFLSGQQEYLALTNAGGPMGGAPAQEGQGLDTMRPLGMMGLQQHQHQQQDTNGDRDDTSDGDEMVRGLWGLDWRRDVTKEGKSMLITTLENEGEYERFMKRFDVEDLQEGFYWVTDRGRKYSKATSAGMQRMRWKDTFNCFFGRRHTKRGATTTEGEAAGEGEGGETSGNSKRRRQRASQKVHCPASLSATCNMDGKVELRYYDNHVEHPVFDGRPKRKRAGEGPGGADKGIRKTRLIQNEHVSAWRTVIRPNQPPKLLRHDKDRMVYVLKGGRLKVVGENNDVKRIYNLEPDKAYWFPKTPPGELQGDVNEGPEAIQIVVVEVESTRQPPPPPPNNSTHMHHHHHMHPAPVGGY